VTCLLMEVESYYIYVVWFETYNCFRNKRFL